jgi:hypothetical protein
VKFKFVLSLLVVLSISACSQTSLPETSDAPIVEPKPCPTYSVLEGQEIPQEQADLLIGMVEADAEACAIDLGWQWRVSERDGEFYALTMDYRPDRVIAQVQEGIINLVNVG